MLPEGWKKASLEDVADIRSGIAKNQKTIANPINLPYLRVANVQDGYLDLTEVKTIEIDKEKIDRFSLHTGDVLMNEGGDFDKLGRGDVWRGQITPCLHQNHVFAVRPDQRKLDSYFLANLSASPYGKGYFLSCAKRSTNLASINSTQLKQFPVILPPLPEQKKIAAILSTWDHAIERTEKLLANSQQQKKALMQQLLTGKKRLPGFTGEWKNVLLKNIALIKKGQALSSKDLIHGDYPVIAGGKTSPYTHKHYTHENVITVSASGAYAGYVSFHSYKIWASDCSVITSRPENNISFIYFWLSYLQNKIFSLQSGGAQPHIYPRDLELLHIHCPPLPEQKAIAAVLTTADEEITAIESDLSRLRQEKKALMQQLLTGKRRVKVD